MNDYMPIETAPRDGTLIKGAIIQPDVPRYAFFRCVWKNGEWRGMEFGNIEHPTHWKPC